MENHILNVLEKEALTNYLNELTPKVAGYLDSIQKHFSPNRNAIISKMSSILLERHRTTTSFNDLDTLKLYLKTLKASKIGNAYFWNSIKSYPVFESAFDKLFICLFNSIINREPNIFYLVSQNGKIGLCVEISSSTITVEKWGIV